MQKLYGCTKILSCDNRLLKSRLKLDISPGKSKVVNLRKNSSDFLGFKIKVLPKGKTRYGYIAKTDMSDKAIKKVTAELKAKVINIRYGVCLLVDSAGNTETGVGSIYFSRSGIYHAASETIF